MNFTKAHAALLADDTKSASLAYIKAINTSESFLQFMDIKDAADLKLQQLNVGVAITDLITLANLRPAEFSSLFQHLFSTFMTQLKRHQTLPPLSLYSTLLLLSFFGMFTNNSIEQVLIETADFYFDAFQMELSEIYCQIFAEQCVFIYIQRKEYKKAWVLEKSEHMLKKLMERDGQGLIELVCILVNLHIMHGDSVENELEILKLRFGEEELAENMRKCQLK
ncbi:Conserved_hypothetical protein [Hexamita inflata]|uniref:Uncharacterized protein n=1 Tax=Hexamita inflata TaxID=28002 RepID=A0AA86NNH9_9EUKA|nr:Conserved hypothetical protein [Hexamita inflata]